MLLHNAQKKFDFEQPDWSKDPELYIIHQILEQRTDVIKLAEPCFRTYRLDIRTNCPMCYI